MMHIKDKIFILSSILFLILCCGCYSLNSNNNEKKEKIEILDGNLWIMNIDGSNQTRLTTDGSDANHFVSPSICIDGKNILYEVIEDHKNTSIWSMDLSSGKQKLVSNNACSPVYSNLNNDFIYFSYTTQNCSAYILGKNSNNETIFNLSAFRDNMIDLAFSNDNTKIIYSIPTQDKSGKKSNSYLREVNISGNRSFIFDSQYGGYLNPAYVPFSDYILINNNYKISKYNVKTHELINLTDDNMISACPKPNSDGTKIVYCSESDDSNTYFDIWTMNMDGSDKKQLTDTEQYNEIYPIFTPDGKKIIFSK